MPRTGTVPNAGKVSGAPKAAIEQGLLWADIVEKVGFL
jgi:hypothetical protein